MNQDGQAGPWSDCDASDANSSSLNNSLSEEEFSIQSSAPGETGLKFKISCLKKSNNNETRKPSRTDLKKKSQQTDPSSQQDGNMEVTTLHDTKSLHTDENQPKAVGNILNSGLNQQSLPPSKSGLRQSADEHFPVSIEHRKWTSKNTSVTCSEHSKDDHEKRFKGNSKVCALNNRSSAVDGPDACFRMDALPNVSPDSGIVSFEGSPFGNESPGSITGIENNVETHGILTAPMDPHHQSSSKCVNSVDMGKCDSSQISLCKETKDNVIVSCLVKKIDSQDISVTENTENDITGLSVTDSLDGGKCTQEKSALSPKTGESVSTTIEYAPKSEQLSSKQLLSEQDSSADMILDEDHALSEKEVIDGDSQKDSNVSAGTEFVLSSPHKISQPAWRRKKGNKQRKKKMLLLNHKKSTLYNVNESSKSSLTTKDSSECQAFGPLDDIGEGQTSKKHVKEIHVEFTDLKSDTRNELLAKKKSPGRPKGSLNKKEEDFHRGTCRRPYKLVDETSSQFPIDDISLQTVRDSSPTLLSSEKRPRGRPRKCLSIIEESLPPQESKARIIKKRRPRKRVFTRMKKTTIVKNVPSDRSLSSQPEKIESQNSGESNLFKNLGDSVFESNLSLHQSLSKVDMHSPVRFIRKGKDAQINDTSRIEKAEKSVFQDSDLDALLQSVNSSISKQFKTDEDNNEMITNTLSFDNPFKSVQAHSFPHIIPSSESHPPTKAIKPKYKKPKLHVMMRKTNRRKKKKKKPEPSRTSAFGVSSPEKRMSFFSSCVQPPKILASSRLNVFQSGTGVENCRAATPSESELQDGFDRRFKRKRRLLNFKSKHKNIIDPVFATKLRHIVSGLHDMAISEDSNDNFIKVRPGEMPLPTIFRVIKIDVSKRIKDRVFFPEPMTAESGKPVKSRKDQLPPEVSSSSKSARKKSSSEQASDSKEQLSFSDTSDQWLPPKKRHRMVHIDDLTPQLSPSANSIEAAVSAGKDGDKRKGRRPKRTGGPDIFKQGGMTFKNIEQELTIDTSSCSGPCSSISAQTPSPCFSRLSTRSSTVPSVSSLSPSGPCSSFRSRYSSKNILACPSHSLTIAGHEEMSSCAECQLIRQSAAASPTNTRVNFPSLQRSLSTQLTVDPVFSSELADSSSESSPCLKMSQAKETVIRRTPRKRRQSSTYSAEEWDSPPLLLEKHCAPFFPSPILGTDNSVPPEISPVKGHLSSQRRSTYWRPQHPAKSIVQTSVSAENLTSKSRSSKQSSSMSSVTSNSELMCNTILDKPNQLSTTTSLSVIYDPDAIDWQPLPLKFCTKRKLVEEIQAALHSDSCDSSDEDEDQDVSNPSTSTPGAASSAQPPRKRSYQRVGLFSDFYKEDEPRRRCETMVRCRDKLIYAPEEHPFGLMPMPVHIGQYYMRQAQDFKLPYDIWWQDVHQQLPKKSEPKIKFRTIKSNVYSDDSKANGRKVEHPMCNCRPPPSGGKGCLEDCLNRMIYTECSATNCPLEANCANQRIQKHDWAPGIEKFQTDDRGFGVRVTQPVKSGLFLLEYLGEVISETEFRRRMMEEYSEECHHYALHLDSGTIIDGYRMGNIGRYVNHSCQPNCEMQKWNVNGLYRMVLFALRDINPFEELVYDYNFDAFNQNTQQECRCGSSECRGVIGGKAQRTNGQNRLDKADDPKDKRKSKFLNKKGKEKKAESMPVQPPTKPMTYKERCYARKHRAFLVRNVDKVLNQRHPGHVFPVPKEEVVDATVKINCVTSDLLLANLSESSVKTRLAALAKDNPEVLRRHRMAQLFDKMLTRLLSLKDEDECCMITPLMSLPSRKKQFEYYKVVKNPIDMSMIKQRVKTGIYHHLSSFNADVMLLFTNVELYCGHKSELGQIILKLRHIFNCVKQEMTSQLDEEMGPGTTKMYMDADLEKLEHPVTKPLKVLEEDIIRCICGVTRDEGLMLQCEKCMKWQHCDCVGASGKEEHYLCDRCEPRYYDPEIPLGSKKSESMPDCAHFMTLVKDDMQYAVGDCVYVMRDCKRTAAGTPLRSSHRLMATTNPDSLDIFRIDKLWKDPKGERFASGTPYLRPQETFHEPTRKFFHNELFRTPNYEIIPLDLVMGKCVVMDPNTYSKGRPKTVKEQDVFICEYRVDKTAHLFHKIKEIWYPINTSTFCFDWFETKLSLKRTFTPHEVPEEYLRRAERICDSSNSSKLETAAEWPECKQDVKKVTAGKHQILHGKVKVDESLKHDVKLKSEVKVNVKKGSLVKSELKQEMCIGTTGVVAKLIELKKQDKRLRLDRLLTKLLQNIPGKQKIDLSYLLDGGRRVRKKLVK